ncbi:proline--tRNA ligase [Patescibacteria group bacterium]|nr:proline--tRNA ligase [Patescibacteria group bacterium]
MAYNKTLPKRSEDLSQWYNAIVLQAELAEYGPAKGTMIIRPYGYAIWEEIQRQLDQKIKADGVENAYFPLFIPEALFNREKEHVEGFSPELAIVTIGGGEELSEKLAIRPTSETIICESFSRWVQSWRDLPIKINQWANVVRWEKRTYMFLRTSEFLWQEGHTIHATHEEAWGMVLKAMENYTTLYQEVMAMPGIVGRKSETEKFAGADVTLTYESLMAEGKALQSCTSHDLGQNFARAFDIAFQDRTGGRQYVWQTSWGLSTRAIGGLIMLHGDDRGLKLPPRIAPIQVVILPVRNEEPLLEFSRSAADQLSQAGFRVKVDDREDESLGRRINKWEVKGVPIRIEIGQREMESGDLKAVRRDTGEVVSIRLGSLVNQIQELLDQVQNSMYAEAERFLQENTREANSYQEFKDIMTGPRGFIRALWCEDAACEAKIKEETKATTRCLPLDAPEENGTCIGCGKPAKHRWYFGQAY